jgi:hypothetical protein
LKWSTTGEIIVSTQIEEEYGQSAFSSFLLTVVMQRNTAYELKKLMPAELRQVDTTVIRCPFPEWYYENEID